MIARLHQRFLRLRDLTARTRGLRANLTDAEQKLWQALRRGQLKGLSFRRQHPIGRYTLEFYCPSLRLGIEVDGGQHNFDTEASRDLKRTAWLASKDIAVLRFWNHDALQNTDGVLEEIIRMSQVRGKLTPSPTLPLSGGGRTPSEP